MGIRAILKELTVCSHYIHVNKEVILGGGERMLREDCYGWQGGRHAIQRSLDLLNFGFPVGAGIFFYSSLYPKHGTHRRYSVSAC